MKEIVYVILLYSGIFDFPIKHLWFQFFVLFSNLLSYFLSSNNFADFENDF